MVTAIKEELTELEFQEKLYFEAREEGKPLSIRVVTEYTAGKKYAVTRCECGAVAEEAECCNWKPNMTEKEIEKDLNRLYVSPVHKKVLVKKAEWCKFCKVDCESKPATTREVALSRTKQRRHKHARFVLIHPGPNNTFEISSYVSEWQFEKVLPKDVKLERYLESRLSLYPDGTIKEYKRKTTKKEGVHYVETDENTMEKMLDSNLLLAYHISDQFSSTNAYYRTGVKEYLQHVQQELTNQGWENYPPRFLKELIQYLRYYKENPSVEQLVKAGYLAYVEDSIKRKVPLTADSVKAQMQMPKNLLRELKGTPLFSTRRKVEAFGEMLREGGPVSEEYAVRLSVEFKDFGSLVELVTEYGYTNKELQGYLEQAWLGQALEYEKTTELLEDSLRMAHLMHAEIEKYPKSLVRTHDLLVRDFKFVNDDYLSREYATRVKELERKYGYRAGGYEIQIPASLKAIAQEGISLKHCVASYAEIVASGKTDILFLRRTQSPNSSYFTIEVKKGTLTQCKSFKNRRMDASTDADAYRFVEAWKEKFGIS